MLIKEAVGPSFCIFYGKISPFVMEKGEGLVCDSTTILIVRGNFSKQPAPTPGNGKKMTFPSVFFFFIFFYFYNGSRRMSVSISLIR